MAKPLDKKRGIPRWVWLLVMLLAATEPAVHIWVTYFPPEGTAPTGLDIGDSVVFAHAMRMFDTDFFSPFATCQDPKGGHSPTYFAAPFFWMYGLIGILGRLFRANEFVFLGFANAIGGTLYLLAVYRFFQTAAPKRANLAFVLFALGGGLGGVLFILTRLAGVHGHPDFEAKFLRYAFYELIEGPRTFPVLMFPRLYYTIPLALYFHTLRQVVVNTRGHHENSSYKWLTPACLCLFVATLINVRLGPMAWGLIALYMYMEHRAPKRYRLRVLAISTIPIALALFLASLMLRMNPFYTAGAMRIVRQSMWLSPFLSLAIFHILLSPRAVGRRLKHIPLAGRLAAWGAIGYLGAFVILYALRLVYYGEYLICSDYSAAKAISDPAILGALAGIGFAWCTRKGHGPDQSSEPIEGWLVLWFLGFLAVSISAFGQGWFMRLVPQRLMVFIGPPMCLLTAAALQHMTKRHRILARSLIMAMVTCGVCSILVAVLCFKGPLGRTPGIGPFAWLHYELMTGDDDQCLKALGPGTVLTTNRFGDFLTMRGNKAIAGVGTLNFAHHPTEELTNLPAEFFADATKEDRRKQIVEQWCVDWIYCPDSPPIQPETLLELRDTPWLTEVASKGQAVLFEVAR